MIQTKLTGYINNSSGMELGLKVGISVFVLTVAQVVIRNIINKTTVHSTTLLGRAKLGLGYGSIAGAFIGGLKAGMDFYKTSRMR